MNRIEQPKQTAVLLSRRLSFDKPSLWLLKAILSIYVCISLVDPMDQMFHVKSIFFLSVLAIWFLRAALGYAKWCYLGNWVSVTAFALVLPTAATLIGLLSGRNPLSGPTFSTLEIFLMLFLVLVVASEEINLVSILNRGCILVALITLTIAVVAVASPLLYDAIFEYTTLKQTAYLSLDTSHIGLGIGSFYYKTSATMILPLGYYTARFYAVRAHRGSSFFLALLFFASLVLSGARANGLAAAAVVVCFSVKKIRDSIGWGAAISASLAVLVLAAASVLPSFFSTKDYSNAVKLGHWSSYVTEFEQHPSYLLWGEGADTEFYSSGFQQKTTITELTFVELVRNFGIPVTLLLLAALCWPLVPLLGRRGRASGISYLAVPYGAYIFMSASNPLLLNTTGMLLVISVWGAVLLLQQRTIPLHHSDAINYSMRSA
jgi:hypothetical protein